MCKMSNINFKSLTLNLSCLVALSACGHKSSPQATPLNKLPEPEFHVEVLKDGSRVCTEAVENYERLVAFNRLSIDELAASEDLYLDAKEAVKEARGVVENLHGEATFVCSALIDHFDATDGLTEHLYQAAINQIDGKLKAAKTDDE
jgi:hypothetical protein